MKDYVKGLSSATSEGAFTPSAEKFGRTTTIRYSLALGLIATLVLIGAWLLSMETAEQQAVSSLINIGGRQRMLTQRIDMLVDEIVLSNNETKRDGARAHLLEVADEMEQSHNWLLNGNLEMGISPVKSESVRLLFFEKPMLLDKRVRAIVTAARDVARMPESEILYTHPALQLIVNEAHDGRLVVAFDELVGLYQKESYENVEKFKHYIIMVFLILILALILEGFYVFRPLARRTKEKILALERAEMELKKLTNAIEQSAQMLLITDANGVIEYVNPAFELQTLYSSKEVIGKTPTILKSGEHDKAFYQNMWGTIKRGEVWSGVIKNRKKNGELYDEGMTISPVKDNEGNITNFIAAKNDITERIKTEEDLQLYRLMIENTADPIFVIDDDDDCKMIFVNEAAVQHYGAPREEILKWRISDWDLSFTYEDLPKHVEDIKKSKGMQIETIHRVNGGKDLVPVEVTLNRTIYKGHLCHFGYFKNISERKKSERELEERISHAEFVAQIGVTLTEINDLHEMLKKCCEAMVEKLNTAFARIWTFNENDELLELQASAGMYTNIDGSHHSVPLGESKIGTIAKSRKPHLTNSVIGDSLVTDQEWAKREGMVSFAGYPLVVEDKLVGVVATFGRKPLTKNTIQMLGAVANEIAIGIERKWGEDALIEAKTLAELSAKEAEDANQAKGTFLANMSHELRTPLNGILGLTELLLESEMSSQWRKRLELIHYSGETLMALVGDILDLSKIEEGKFRLDKREFDLVDTIERTVSQQSLTAQNKGLEFVVHIDPDIPCLLIGDPARLRQVIVNLVGNAIKFTEKGEVVLRVKLKDQTENKANLIISISDTGVGIAKDRQKAIFERFTQEDSSTTRRYGGVGLGTTITKELVTLMGGELWLESVVNEGSIFYFTVCLGVVGEGKGPMPLVNVGAKDLHVLIVDDNKIAMSALAEMLSAAGIMCEVASNDVEALEKFSASRSGDSSPINLLFLDENMPGGDTVSLVGKIRDYAGSDPIKIVLLSAGRSLVNQESGSKLFDAFVDKPVFQSEIFKTIAKLFSNSDGGSVAEAMPAGALLPTRGISVLLVEDNMVNQEVAIGALEQLGYNVVVANNGHEGFLVWEAGSFDIILMDVQMPIMDGIEATKRIRKKELVDGSHIPIIAMTAHAMEGDRESYIASGMDDYISKPISLKSVSAALERVAPSLPDGGFAGSDEDISTQSTERAYDLTMVRDLLAGDEKKIKQLVATFIESSDEHIADLKKALDNNDASLALLLIHTVKGASGQLGASRLNAVAKEIEIFCVDEKLDEARKKLPLLAGAFVQVKKALMEEQ